MRTFRTGDLGAAGSCLGSLGWGRMACGTGDYHSTEIGRDVGDYI